MSADMQELLELNAEYIRAVQESDVTRFEALLADDFLCTHFDGSFVDRAQFLKQTAAPSKLSGLQAHDVDVRLFGDFAIVHGRTEYTKPDGFPGRGRYTDVYARRKGRWQAIAAHVTRA
jgi:ketosteroid isomerase-like protein